IIQKTVAQVGATSDKDFGKVMGPVMKELKGKADGKLIQDTVKSILASLQQHA
ncbi:MAG: GatB/YqeY domain-containing protein, partial [Bacteroidetes bacterium]